MKRLAILSLIIFTAFTGCQKEGPKGDPGTNGTNGVDGNANVIGTNDVTVNTWTASGNSWVANISAPGVTADIVQDGLVQVFIQYGPEWWALPDFSGINTTMFGFSEGIVTLMNQDIDGSTTPNPGSRTFRIVIISSSGLAQNPDTDWTDYEQVKEALDL